jgi:hypothetical protein
MIITVDKFRKYVTTDITDEELEARLSALETAIRKYTNNNFNVRRTYQQIEIKGGKIIFPPYYLNAGDTIQIHSDAYDNQIFTVISISVDELSVNAPLRYDGMAFMSIVEYPDDVVMGVVNLMKWDISQREKMGIKSESISRWSVTYFDLESNSLLGYPASLLGFCKPYMKARF